SVLQEHFALGRLSMDELTLRVAAAQSAITWGDLYKIFGDLPVIPGMEIGPPPPYPSTVPTSPPPQTNIYMVPPPPVVVNTRSSGNGALSAALVCFILGFFTCGITWIPAVILAIIGLIPQRTTVASHIPSRSYNSPTPPTTRAAGLSHARGFGAGAIIACAIGAIVLIVAIGTAVVTPREHAVEVRISSSTEQSFAGEARISTKTDNLSGTDLSLPHVETFIIEGSLSAITVTVADGYSGKTKKKRKVPISCTIIVDGDVVSESTDDGKCYASYSGSR